MILFLAFIYLVIGFYISIKFIFKDTIIYVKEIWYVIVSILLWPLIGIYLILDSKEYENFLNSTLIDNTVKEKSKESPIENIIQLNEKTKIDPEEYLRQTGITYEQGLILAELTKKWIETNPKS